MSEDRVRVGIASLEQLEQRARAIARGERRRGPDEPRIWFTSIESFAKVLSDSNRELLAIIEREQPGSLTELAELSGRKQGNLSRTLKTMSLHGLVSLERGERGAVVPKVLVREVTMDLALVA